MRPRNVLLMMLLGAAAAVLPAMASSEGTPTISAKANGTGLYPEPYSWAPSEATIAQGASVTFNTGTTGAPHGIVWTSSIKPTCASSIPVGENAEPREHWSGDCTFSEAGVYTFHCLVHPTEMIGKIVVNATGTTTTMSVPALTPVSPPTTTTAPLGAVALPAVQRGTSVHGSASVGQAHSRLEIDLLASSASLARAKKRVLAGRVVLSSVGPGKVSFKVSLGAKAKRALRRRKHLSLVVRIVLTPPSGHVVNVSKGLLLRH